MFINSDSATRNLAERCDHNSQLQEHSDTNMLPAAQVEGLRSDISYSLFCGGSAQWLKERQAQEK